MIVETEQLRLESPVSERDHVIGPPNARVTVVTYGDYDCPACQSRHRATEKMFDRLRGRVRFVYRHFPLLKVHAHALRAAEAAEAAAAQGKFWQMHRLLYLHSNKLRDSDLRGYARTIGLDLVRFDREMASGVYADQIKKSCYDSIINGISGAPTTFVNGVLFAKSGVELLTAVQSIAEESLPVFSHRM
jgi:formate-nitrite transporter family protein